MECHIQAHKKHTKLSKQTNKHEPKGNPERKAKQITKPKIRRIRKNPQNKNPATKSNN